MQRTDAAGQPAGRQSRRGRDSSSTRIAPRGPGLRDVVLCRARTFVAAAASSAAAAAGFNTFASTSASPSARCRATACGIHRGRLSQRNRSLECCFAGLCKPRHIAEACAPRQPCASVRCFSRCSQRRECRCRSGLRRSWPLGPRLRRCRSNHRAGKAPWAESAKGCPRP